MSFLIYNDNSKSCLIHDKKTLLDFARYVTTKEKYPIALVTVRRKFYQPELQFCYEEEGEV
jgi:hypothetical protein